MFLRFVCLWTVTQDIKRGLTIGKWHEGRAGHMLHQLVAVIPAKLQRQLPSHCFYGSRVLSKLHGNLELLVEKGFHLIKAARAMLYRWNNMALALGLQQLHWAIHAILGTSDRLMAETWGRNKAITSKRFITPLWVPRCHQVLINSEVETNIALVAMAQPMKSGFPETKDVSPSTCSMMLIESLLSEHFPSRVWLGNKEGSMVSSQVSFAPAMWSLANRVEEMCLHDQWITLLVVVWRKQVAFAN